MKGFDEVPSKRELFPTGSGPISVDPNLANTAIRTLINIAFVATQTDAIGVRNTTLDIVGTKNTITDDLTLGKTTTAVTRVEKNTSTRSASATPGTSRK